MKRFRAILISILTCLAVVFGVCAAQNADFVQFGKINKSSLQNIVATADDELFGYVCKVPVNVYDSGKDAGFTLKEKVDQTVFGTTSYTGLSLVSDGAILKTTYNGYDAFGIIGSDVSLSFAIRYEGEGDDWYLNGSDTWMLSVDTWGKKETETVNGVQTGEVGSGAIIVQTSMDGVDWSDENKASYTNGLYTTDYYTHYGTTPQSIYTPSGQDVGKGIYVRVLYAYEVYDYIKCTHKNFWGVAKHTNDNVYYNYVEEYSFYLCYNDVEAVTFHNLSLEGQITEDVEGEEAALIEIGKRAETLTDGSLTTTGFVIDKSLNESAAITAWRNGVEYAIPANGRIEENGRYDIRIQTTLGWETIKTFYVNKKGQDELYSMYFGDSFLEGKRIFTKGDLPTYEGGLTAYTIIGLGENEAPLWGTITNKTTGNVIQISCSYSTQTDVLTEAGEYEVKLHTNATYGTDKPSGDNHTFTFKFIVIEEGSAPGPQVNQENLQAFASLSNPSSMHSVYYGVTFQSAHRGYITLAFSSRAAALEYVYNYEKGMVEEQEDGSFRYTGTLNVTQKIVYDSAWDLTDAIYYFAEQAVQRLCFDLRDEFTYLTLSQEVLDEITNLKTLELTKSIVVAANDTEKENLFCVADIPLINAKQYAYLQPGVDGEVVSGVNSFQFIKDKNGYDSNSIVAIVGDTYYTLAYNQPIDEQFKAYGLGTGIITIEERNIYNDISVYKVAYIAEGDCTTKIELKFHNGNETTSEIYDLSKNGESIKVKAFAVDKLTDEFDSCGLVIIKKDGEPEVYCAGEDVNKTYNEAGVYNITVLNRLGTAYSFTIEIEETSYTIQLKGDGIDGEQYITYHEGDVVALPTLTKYGYNFVGYRTESGNVYSDEVAAILLKGNAVLEAVWEAKQFHLTLRVGDEIYLEGEVVFGETYLLPTLTSTEEQTFVGWENEENEIVTFITLNREGNVNLRAVYKNNSVKPEDSSSDTGSDSDSDSSNNTDSGDSSVDSSTDSSENNSSGESSTDSSSSGEIDDSSSIGNSADSSSSSSSENSTETPSQKEEGNTTKRNTSKARSGGVWFVLILLFIIGVVLIVLGSIAVNEMEEWHAIFIVIGAILALLCLLTMIWPQAFWWFTWWYY